MLAPQGLVDVLGPTLLPCDVHRSFLDLSAYVILGNRFTGRFFMAPLLLAVAISCDMRMGE